MERRERDGEKGGEGEREMYTLAHTNTQTLKERQGERARPLVETLIGQSEDESESAREGERGQRGDQGGLSVRD